MKKILAVLTIAFAASANAADSSVCFFNMDFGGETRVINAANLLTITIWEKEPTTIRMGTGGPTGYKYTYPTAEQAKAKYNQILEDIRNCNKQR